MADRPDDQRRHDEARDMLRDELRDAVGEEAAERAERKGALDEAIDADRPRTILGVISESRALIVITFFVALIVGALIALITGAWWFVLVALLLHAVGTVIVVATAISLASEVEHADPSTAAALEARGVTDPDGALNHAVDVAAEDSEGEAARAREQQTEITPSSRSTDG
jgi:membrane protein implicated in regulation of membrane protease activity